MVLQRSGHVQRPFAFAELKNVLVSPLAGWHKVIGSFAVMQT
jgi:hypothetical protein